MPPGLDGLRLPTTLVAAGTELAGAIMKHPETPKAPVAQYHPGQLISWRGDVYIVTGMKHAPALKWRRLSVAIKHALTG
jgi:hypothetical protein